LPTTNNTEKEEEKVNNPSPSSASQLRNKNKLGLRLEIPKTEDIKKVKSIFSGNINQL